MDKNIAYLADIEKAMKKNINFSSQNSKEDFFSSDWDQDAVIRNFQIMGEAVKRLDEAYKESHAAIPWQKIVSMRNFVIHEYDAITLQTIWETIKDDLPTLLPKITLLLDEALKNENLNRQALS